MAIVTCHTEGCRSADVPVSVATTVTDEETGEERSVDGVVCGACGNPITDVEPPLT